jgi:hypothetical protein
MVLPNYNSAFAAVYHNNEQSEPPRLCFKCSNYKQMRAKTLDFYNLILDSITAKLHQASIPINRWTSVGRQSKAQWGKLDSKSLVETESHMCQAKCNRKNSTANHSLHAGEKNTLELSGLATTSAGATPF